MAFGPASGETCGLGASWVAAAGDGSGAHGGPGGACDSARAHAGEQSVQLLGADAAEVRAAVQGVAAKCKGLVIEVNGPSHYDSSRRLRPESRIKLRHLQLDGWTVLEVPCWEWDAKHGAASKAAYVSSLLRSSAAAP